MNTQPDARMDLAELARRVEDSLAVGYRGPANGQVSAIPSPRTIRYYTTLGLLDPPAEMRGRTALYGERHLFQLVAIKRLQAAGRSLVEVQRRLAGLPDAELRALAEPAAPFWARVPGGVGAPVAEGSGSGSGSAGVEAPESNETLSSSGALDDSDDDVLAEGMWLAPVAPSPPDAPSARAAAHAAKPTAPSPDLDSAGSPAASAPAAAPLLLHAIALGSGATLTFPALRELRSDDLGELRRATADLRAVLMRRGLLDPDSSTT